MGTHILSTIQHHLVTHPNILHFTWTPPQTLGSSPTFLFLAILTYLTLTLLLPRLPLSTLPPIVLKPITALHSATLSLLSLVMAAGCALSLLSAPRRHAVCFPPDTPPSGPVFFWAHVFYLSKLLELVDTLLIVLSESASRRLTFLHVYHHATVLVMCYLWLSTSQSLFPVALVTNSLVHVAMYAYYMCCALGARPRWKRLVTDLQIVQFLFSFVVSGWMLYEHFLGGGCSGFNGWCFNAAFNASLLALFLDFHGKSYKRKRGEAAVGIGEKNKRS